MTGSGSASTRNFAAAVQSGPTLAPEDQPHPDTSLLETGEHVAGPEIHTSLDGEADKVNGQSPISPGSAPLPSDMLIPPATVVDEKTAEALRTAMEQDEPSEAAHFDQVKEDRKLRAVHAQAQNAAALANQIKTDHKAADKKAEKAEVEHTKELVHDVAEEAAKKAKQLHREGHFKVDEVKGEVKETAEQVKDKAGEAKDKVKDKAEDVAAEAKSALNKAEHEASKVGKKLSAEAKEFYADPKNTARKYADKAGQKGAEFVDEAEDKFAELSRKAKAEGRELDAEVRAFYADPKNKSKEYVAKGKKAASEAEKKAEKAARAAAREIRSHPFATSGVVGLLNLTLLAGTGYLAYTNWTRPHWDRKVVSAVAAAWATIGGLQALGYHEVFEAKK